jgi:serine/threonine-protein kinase RIO1
VKTPKRLQALVHEGLIDAVVRQLMSGKEANVFVVRWPSCAVRRSTRTPRIAA